MFSLLDVQEPSRAVLFALRHQKVLGANGFPVHAERHSKVGLASWIDDGAKLETNEPSEEFIRVVTGCDQEGLERSSRKVVLADIHTSDLSDFEPNYWKSCGVEAAVAVSQPLRFAIESRFGIPTTVISPSVDRTLFAPAPKIRSIAYRVDHPFPEIQKVLNGCRDAGYALESIQGQSFAEVREILSRACLFLDLGRSEAFCFSTLEAMACGCLVVGFATEGGRDFMEDGSNCLLAADGEYDRVAQNLDMALRLTEEGRTTDLTQEAIRTARKFSPGREAVEILRFWTAYLRTR